LAAPASRIAAHSEHLHLIHHQVVQIASNKLLAGERFVGECLAIAEARRLQQHNFELNENAKYLNEAHAPDIAHRATSTTTHTDQTAQHTASQPAPTTANRSPPAPPNPQATWPIVGFISQAGSTQHAVFTAIGAAAVEATAIEIHSEAIINAE